MQHPVDAALADPWGTLRLAVGDPLHPGGYEATERLLDRADVTAETRLLDVGCGAGGALELARERGADAVGLDADPAADDSGVVRGNLTDLPVADGTVDVVLAECVLCLSGDLDRSLAETHRVLDSGGRLALSDVVVEGDLPDVPAELARGLCLTGQRDRACLRERVAGAGFAVDEVRDHREDLLAMRDRATERVDYEGLLGALGERGRRLRDGIEALETAIDEGRVGYVSLVGRA